MSTYSPAQPTVLIASANSKTLTNYYSWATFLNDGGADGTIDFGAGNVVTLKTGESITLPYLGRAYGETTVNAAATTIKIVYVR